MTSPISCQGQLVRAAVQWYQCPVHYPWEPGPQTHRGPLGTFQWMHGVRKPDASTMIRPTDSFVKKRPRFRRWRVYASLVFIGEQWDIAAMGLLSEICQTYKYNLPSLYKYNLPSTSVQVQIQYQVCFKAKSLYKMYSCWVFLFTKNEYYQMMKSVDSTTYDYVMYFYTKYIHKRRYYNRLINMNQNWVTKSINPLKIKSVIVFGDDWTKKFDSLMKKKL